MPALRLSECFEGTNDPLRDTGTLYGQGPFHSPWVGGKQCEISGAVSRHGIDVGMTDPVSNSPRILQSYTLKNVQETKAHLVSENGPPDETHFFYSSVFCPHFEEKDPSKQLLSVCHLNYSED